MEAFFRHSHTRRRRRRLWFLLLLILLHFLPLSRKSYKSIFRSNLYQSNICLAKNMYEYLFIRLFFFSCPFFKCLSINKMHVYHKKETTPYVCNVNRTNVYNEYDNGTLSSYIFFFPSKAIESVHVHTRPKKQLRFTLPTLQSNR